MFVRCSENLGVFTKWKNRLSRLFLKPRTLFQKMKSLLRNPQLLRLLQQKSKGGRPAGAKDKAPRKKKIVIVEEPIAKAPVEIEEPTPQPKPAKELVRREVQFEEPARAQEEPPSPRTIIRQSAGHMLELKRLNDSARKTHLQNTYTRRLVAF